MNNYITFLFIVIFTIWTVRLYYKLYDKKTKRYILLIGILIIFWMLIRIIKGILNNLLLERMCWYLYYLPLIFIPTLYYISSMSLLSKMSNKRRIFIYLVSCILFLLVLTNDYHYLVFKFNKSILEFNDYTHYIGYYLICVWIFYLFSKSLVYLAIYRMKIKKDLKGFLPFIVILLGLLYTILYVIDTPYIRNINMSIVNSLLICIGIELALYLNLIPNNDRYISIFSKSYLDMAIVSLNGKLMYTTNSFSVIPSYIVKDIESSKVKDNYIDKCITYEVKKNKDSYVILKKDLSNIHSIEQEIKRQRKELLTQQKSLKLEEKTTKELYEIQLRKEVIQKVEDNLNKKRSIAKDILSNSSVTKSNLEKVRRIIIYSKKKSMLMISSLNEDIYNEEGIKVLLMELFSSMNKVNGYVSINDMISIKGEVMSLIYDIIYELIESNLGKSIMVFITRNKSDVIIKCIVNTSSYINIDIDKSVMVKQSTCDNDTTIVFTLGGVL